MGRFLDFLGAIKKDYIEANAKRKRGFDYELEPEPKKNCKHCQGRGVVRVIPKGEKESILRHCHCVKWKEVV